MKVKVFIPIVSSTIFNQVFITKEYDCWKIKAEENHLNIYAKVPDNHPHELLACFNWSQIIGYEVVKFDFQKPDYKHLLSNLLSVIHRDGGHFEQEHGTEEAVKQAEHIWGARKDARKDARKE